MAGVHTGAAARAQGVSKNSFMDGGKLSLHTNAFNALSKERLDSTGSMISSRMPSDRTMRGLLSNEAELNDPRTKTLKGRIIAPYVEGHFAATYEGLKMYGPIFKFADRQIEKEYHVFMNNLMEPLYFDNAMFGAQTMVFKLLILILGMYLYLDTIYPVYYWAMGLVELANLCCFLYFISLPKVGILRRNAEVAMFVALCTFLTAIYAGTIVVMESPQILNAPTGDLISLVFAAFVSAYHYYLVLSAASATTMPSRAKVLVYFIAYAALGMTAVTVVFGNVVRHLENNYHASAIELLTYVNIWIWAAVVFIQRCMSECRARIDFLKYATAKKNVAELKKEMKSSNYNKKGGTTGVEEILKWLNEAIRIVRDVGVEINAVELQESLNLMDETILKLTNTDKLFSVDVAKMSGHDQESARTMMDAFGNTNLKNLLEAKRKMSASPAATPAAAPGPVRSNRKRFTVKIATPIILTPPLGRGESGGEGALEYVLDDEFKEKAGRQWDFNVLKYSEETKNILVEMGMALVAPSVRQSHADQDTAQRLFIEIQKRYFANPYHNAIHGATVAHTSMSLCRMLGIHKGLSYDPQSELTLIVSALGHDMGHPGRNNAFFINCVHPIAALYNDASVLENLHCALLFTLLSKPELNLFDSLSFEEFMILRYRIIELVLATDMKMHFEGQTIFRVRRASPEFDFDKNVEDMWLMLKMCLKAADLSHGALQWTQHVEWSMRVTEEFYKQGDHEVLMGMPKSPLCDRDTHKGLAKSQKGFIGFVVHPLYIELDAAANGALQSTCMIRLAENTVRWEERASLEVVTPMPEAVSVIPTHVPQLKELMRELLPSNKKKEKATVVLKLMKDRKGKGTQTDDSESDDDETATKLTRGLSGALVGVDAEA